MAVFTVTGNYLNITHGGEDNYYPTADLEVKVTASGRIQIRGAYQGQSARSRIYDAPWGEVTGPRISGTTAEEVGEELVSIISATDVAVQDQHTPVVIAHANQTHAQTTLNGAIAIGDYDIELTSATGAVVGNHIVIFDPVSVRFMDATIVTLVTTTATLDTPVDFAFPDGSFIDIGTVEMAVNGSVTPEVFGVRGTGNPAGIVLSFDITRIIFTAICTSAVSLSLFGNLTALTNGLVLRKRDGIYHNIFNVKSNREFAGVAYDFIVASATNPQQGEDGFSCRLTFAGQSKIGVTVRLEIGEDLEFIIQDDLTGLTSLKCIVEGHIVEN